MHPYMGSSIAAVTVEHDSHGWNVERTREKHKRTDADDHRPASSSRATTICRTGGDKQPGNSGIGGDLPERRHGGAGRERRCKEPAPILHEPPALFEHVAAAIRLFDRAADSVRQT